MIVIGDGMIDGQMALLNEAEYADDMQEGMGRLDIDARDRECGVARSTSRRTWREAPWRQPPRTRDEQETDGSKNSSPPRPAPWSTTRGGRHSQTPTPRRRRTRRGTRTRPLLKCALDPGHDAKSRALIPAFVQHAVEYGYGPGMERSAPEPRISVPQLPPLPL